MDIVNPRNQPSCIMPQHRAKATPESIAVLVGADAISAEQWLTKLADERCATMPRQEEILARGM
jgi:hypothetical protein